MEITYKKIIYRLIPAVLLFISIILFTSIYSSYHHSLKFKDKISYFSEIATDDMDYVIEELEEAIEIIAQKYNATVLSIEALEHESEELWYSIKLVTDDSFIKILHYNHDLGIIKHK